MKLFYEGYVIECMANETWNGSHKGKTLTVRKEGTQTFLASQWWMGTVREGVRYGKGLVDRKLKAELNSGAVK